MVAMPAMSGRRGARVLVAALVLAAGYASAPAALASTLSWSGKASSASHGWSAGANWVGGSGPAPSSTVSLSFPLLGSQCSVENPSEACYESEENVSALTAESMDVSDGGEYEIDGSTPITLGSGGLSSGPEGTASGYAELGVPLTLGAKQTWRLSGSSRESLANHLFLLEGEVKGAGSELTVEAERSVEFAIGADVNVGAIDIEGADASGNRDENAIVGVGGGGSLNAGDGHAVRLAHVFFFGSGEVGALETEAATLAIGSGETPAGRLEAASVALDGATGVEFEVHGTGGPAGTGYSQLTARGAVSLSSATLVVMVPKEGATCSPLPLLQTYTLVSTSGELTGTFGNAPEGAEIPVDFASGCGSMPSQKLWIAYDRSGATKTVTATVAGSASSTTSLSIAPGSPVTDQPVTLTATVNAAAGLEPQGSVSFDDRGGPLSGCSNQPVVLDGGAYTATCATAFSAASSPVELSATYMPREGIHVLASESSVHSFQVGRAPTQTTVSASTVAPAAGQQVTYTATVVQGVAPLLSGPTGSVSFEDNGAAIGSCAPRPLTVAIGSSTATCTVTYEGAGDHSVKADYLGDPNFAVSSSGAVAVSASQNDAGSEKEATHKTGSSASEARLRLLGRKLKLKGGAASVDLRCEGHGRCEGVVELVEQVKVRVHHKSRVRTIVIGSAHYRIAVGRTSTIKIKVNSAGRHAVARQRGHLNVRVETKSPKQTLGKVAIQS